MKKENFYTSSSQLRADQAPDPPWGDRLNHTDQMPNPPWGDRLITQTR